MNCAIAREALSARLDGESEGAVPVDVDRHLEECSDCCSWYVRADLQARDVRELGTVRTPDLSGAISERLGERAPESASGRAVRATGRNLVAAGLALCGVAQLGVAVAQMSGFHFGMGHHTHAHGDSMSAHIMNETTAFSLALGVLMVAAALWRPARSGLLLVLGVFALVLGGYVVRDAMASGVTAERIVSHLPVFLGLIFTLILVRRSPRNDPEGAVLPSGEVVSRPTLVQHDSAA